MRRRGAQTGRYLLGRSAVAVGAGVDRRGDTDVATERARGLLRHGGLSGLPAEATKHRLVLCSSLQTRLARPEMPSPSASSGSAPARMSSSRTASSSPMPMIGGVTRGDSMVSR